MTIVAARYGGIYEPGKWLAFALSPEQLPPEWNAGDAECLAFFTTRNDVGGGDSPTEAYDDLLRRQAEHRERA